MVLAVNLTGAGLYWLGLRSVDLRALDDSGLVTLLPAAALAGLALLACAFTVTLALRRERAGLLAWQLLVLVACLHAAVAVIEQVPRFQTAWVHAGFTDYILRTGATLPEEDARFSWPGFFALSAFAAQAGGSSAVTQLLRWTPTLSNLAYLLPLLVIARAMTTHWRARWLAAWLFVLGNWVAQDYYSPQGLAFLLYLVIVAVALTWFRPPYPELAPARTGRDLLTRAQALLRRASRPRLLRPLAALVPGPDPGLRRPPESTPADRGLMLGVLLVVFLAITVSHQLTPFAVIAAVAVLVAADRVTLRGLPLLLVTLVAVWVSWMTVAYWSGNLGTMLGSLGSLATNLGDNLGDRIVGTRERQLVQYGRIAFTAAVLALAALGAVRRRRAGSADRTITLLALAPFVLVALQSYGGEALFRVYFFALPFLALLAALAFFPTRGPRRSPAALAATLAVSLVLLPGFVLARYGNEVFERYTPGEIQAMHYVYDHVPTGSTVVTIAPSNLPGPSERVEDIRYVAVLEDGRQARLDLAGLRRRLADHQTDAGPAVLVLTRAQRFYVQANLGRPASWVADLEDQARDSAAFRVEYANPDAAVLTLAATPDTLPDAPVSQGGPR